MIDERKEEISEEESFEELLAKTPVEHARLSPGEKVEARILKISPEWVFLDTGRKGEGVIDRKELVDAEGQLTAKEGEMITAFFMGQQHGELRFTTKIGGGAAGQNQLEEAFRSRIPVEGHVEREVKGGFEVKVGGVRAFCPYSQTGLRRGEDTAALIGKHLSFRITEYAENGRNIVLSHRAVLEDEREKKKAALKETLKEGMTVRGKVASLQKFGAFIDLGGVEGLLPISELGWGRVEDVGEVLSVGQEVEVTVKQLDWENDRISLSRKDTLTDPWEKVQQELPEGSYRRGKVVRLAAFGAFVNLAPGIDGLVHISKLGEGRRINHPREVVKEGDEMEVKVEGIDRENRRISLAPARAARAAEEEESVMSDFRRKAAEPSTGMGTLGDLLKAKLEGQKKRK